MRLVPTAAAGATNAGGGNGGGGGAETQRTVMATGTEERPSWEHVNWRGLRRVACAGGGGGDGAGRIAGASDGTQFAANAVQDGAELPVFLPQLFRRVQFNYGEEARIFKLSCS